MRSTEIKFTRIGVENNFLPGGKKQVSHGRPFWEIGENHMWW